MSKNSLVIENILNDPVKVASFILSQVNFVSVYNSNDFMQASQHKGSVSIVCPSTLCDKRAAIINDSVNLIKEAYNNLGKDELDIIHKEGTVHISLNNAKNLHKALPIQDMLQIIRLSYEEESRRKLTLEDLNRLMSSVSNVSTTAVDSKDIHASIVNDCNNNTFVDRINNQERTNSIALSA